MSRTVGCGGESLACAVAATAAKVRACVDERVISSLTLVSASRCRVRVSARRVKAEDAPTLTPGRSLMSGNIPMNHRVVILQTDRSPDLLPWTDQAGATLAGYVLLGPSASMRIPTAWTRIAALEPASVLIDVRGLAVAEIGGVVVDARRAAPGAKIVAVGNKGDRSAAEHAIAAGAAAFVSRELTGTALYQAVRTVVAGGLHMGETGKRAIATLLSSAAGT